ncbi:hypothetical protein AGABI2DRAFT_117682 [Agaricus bisporus var. bisporus H97]|uniref:hypothetical protein n=1 Tax=Agaricus bisporus var. bisporus (strain H97 / ATCC MYA-4626 / FGSC 10389) TaxID=936046 RepID=UPI00029F7AF8|nr:hypothetical protein AGABI2DRAFT_117682 [Agaricus bisporus var. bisporus H97]EKV47100.1 hypothetical protein AGABI2DRAFT_117682 [Agaricus bisporus var. bisporus H97]
MESAYLQSLPSLRHIASWDDKILLSQDPLQGIFASWKNLLAATKQTRSARESRLDGLKARLHEELLTKGIKSELHYWVNLAFNASPTPVKEKEKTLRVEKRDLRLFIDIQWALFDNDPDLLKMLTREISQRGGQYVSFTKPKSAASPKTPTRAIQKRKSPAVQRKKAHKRPDIVSVSRPMTRSRSDLRCAGVPDKATHHDDIAEASKRQSPRNATQAMREKDQGLVRKSLVRVTRVSGSKRRKMGMSSSPSLSARSVAGRHRAKTGGALRSKKRQLKNQKCRRSSSQPMKGTPTFSSTQAPNGDIIREDCETTCEPLDNDYAVSSRQEEIPPLPLPPPHLDTLIRLDGSSGGPLPVTPLIYEIQNSVEVKQLTSSPLLPAENITHKWLQEADDYSIDVEIDKPHTDSQASLPINCLPTVKPPLPGNPPIWAQSRQEVCESFDWFRSYQGGVYHSRNVARGYLLSAFAASRDIFTHGGRLIISHGGGKAQSVRTRQGQHIPQEAADQLAQDKSVRALLENYRTHQPIVLLIDDKYVQFPYDLGSKDITYAVLGFYTIVHAWAEYQPAENERGRVVRYKFAFQWCETQGEPWWLKFDFSGSSGGDDLTRKLDNGLEYVEQSFAPFEHIEAISMRCLMCQVSSAQIYHESWTCLNPDCPRFWLDMNDRLLSDELEYNSRFTQLAPASALAIPAEKLEPCLPGPTSPGLTTDYAYTRGWHCKDCGRLSCRLILFTMFIHNDASANFDVASRYKWEYWECMHCKAVLPVAQRVRIATEFIFFAPPVSFKDSSIANDSGIEQQVFRIFELQPFDGSFGQCFTYRLPEGRGFIHHIKTSNPFWNKEADEIFEEYQEQASTGALPFRRWPLRAHKCRGALLTNYFSQNAGVPYQYVGGTENTLPFDKVPNAVVRARDLIQTRVKQALGRDETFNEVLSAAYMERQKMAFHTDDEIGLGPFVSGLSFGSPALMHFRLLARHCPEGVPRSIAITLVLRHGDVLAMDGAGVQQFYESVPEQISS